MHRETVAANPRKEISIAVLPFRLLAEGSGLQPLALGFTEDLIINFSRFVGLSVISQYSTQDIKSAADTEAIARLGADYLVSGSFTALGEQVQLRVQLIRTTDTKVVFASQYDESRAGLLGALDTITRQVVNVLQQKIDYDLLSYSYRKQPVNLDAYENWLMGMEYLRKGSPEHDLKARNYFEAALKADRGYARAYTGISLSYFNEWSCQLWERWDVSRNGAQKYALKALELDENDYISLTVLGRTYLFTGDYEKAEHCLRKSVLMNPNDAENLVQVAFSMVFLGLVEEAEKLYRKAVQLDPLHYDAYFAYGATIWFELGDYDKALELGRKVEIEDTWVDFSLYLAAACHYTGDAEGMQAYWQTYLERFRVYIYSGKQPLEQEALEWNIRINPYRNGTRLQEFWDYMRRQRGIGIPAAAKPEAAPLAGNTFRQNGEMWELAYEGQKILLKDAKGLHDIKRLLAEPEREFPCLELMGATELQPHKGVAVVDAQAKTSYRNRLAELRTAIEEAEEMHDTTQLATLQEEYDQLLAHLSGALGLGGRARQAGSQAEKARAAITWRIRNAIKKIELLHPSLGRHLSHSIKTGALCAYRPEGAVEWE